MQLCLIRNATLLLEYAGHRLLLDPDFGPKHSRASFTGKSANPTVDLPLTVENILEGLGLVLVSHLHQDHFDEVAAEVLPKNLPLLCQPGDEERIWGKGFTNVTPVEDSLEWNGIHITRTPGEHGQGAVLDLMGKVSGFVLQAEGEPTLYWAGDTVLYTAVREIVACYRLQVIVSHSGGALWESYGLILMDAAQTMELCQIARQSTVVAVHMEALDHCTVSRAELRQATRKAGIPDTRLLIPTDGEALTL